MHMATTITPGHNTYKSHTTQSHNNITTHEKITSFWTLIANSIHKCSSYSELGWHIDTTRGDDVVLFTLEVLHSIFP